MGFREWQELKPAAAARRIHEHVRARLSPAQQRAVIAFLASEAELVERFESVPIARRGRGLAGVPYFAKDLFDVAGFPTMAGSTFLHEARGVAKQDGALVQAMSAAGAVLAGKTHLHEFAYGITGENPHYGDVEHPGFPGRTTGGSSSGSAAIVAAGIAPLALGTDTGGSVRIPAAFCGLYGFRLTPQDPWIRDAMALAPTVDTAGWFTATAADLRTTNAALVPARPGAQTPRGCWIDMPGLDDEVRKAFRNGAARFAPEAAAGLARELEHGFAPALDIYHTIVAHESWTVHEAWAEQYRSQYSPVVWQRLSRAHALTPAQVENAERGRTATRGLWTQFFREYDFLVLPGSPTPALTKAECTAENRNRILALTAPASLGGLPVLTIPLPLPSGLTTGLQIVVNDPESPVVDWALRQCE